VAAPPPAPAVPQPDPTRIYTMVDKDVNPPVIVRQEMPRLTPAMKSQARETGVVEIVIDEMGRVSFVAIRQSVHPVYDSTLMAAVREWKYQPATIGGKPVKYRKLIQINVSRQE
jgi:TonB family protein